MKTSRACQIVIVSGAQIETGSVPDPVRTQ